jgi:hypothetical protein
MAFMSARPCVRILSVALKYYVDGVEEVFRAEVDCAKATTNGRRSATGAFRPMRSLATTTTIVVLARGPFPRQDRARQCPNCRPDELTMDTVGN